MGRGDRQLGTGPVAAEPIGTLQAGAGDKGATSMTEPASVSCPVTGTQKTLSFEAGKMAQLADGAVVAQLGDTMVLVPATASRSVREGVDFFPLTVDIE